MAMTLEELAARLAAEAERRGLAVEVFVDELAARLDDPLEAFIGSGASGRAEPFDIRRERAQLAARRQTDER
jgi:hypothetical protein